MRDGELNPSTLRRPQAPRTAAALNRITAEPRNRILLPLALGLTLLAAPLLLIEATAGRAHPRAMVRTVAVNSSVADGYGVPDGILTAADLAAASADGATASGAAAGSGPASGAPASAAGSAAIQAHIAAVSPPSPVTAPLGPTTRPTSSPPATSAPTTTARSTTTTTTRPTTTTTRPQASSSRSQSGPASWYDAPAGTCAHPSLPFGTVVTVENLANGATTTCRVEDRGPYQGGRIIDLSEQSFSQIAPTSDGVIQVRISW